MIITIFTCFCVLVNYEEKNINNTSDCFNTRFGGPIAMKKETKYNHINPYPSDIFISTINSFFKTLFLLNHTYSKKKDIIIVNGKWQCFFE